MENKCNTCFYALMDKDLEAPCMLCTGYSNYVKGTIYMTDNNKQDTMEEDFWVSYKGITHDPVAKPKHYMLFAAEDLRKDEGIEVRDVIKKLVSKMKAFGPMFIADYVQMMQYGMRFMDKNGLEDLKKMRWYLDEMIAEYEHHV